MKFKTKIIISLSALLVSFAAGRFSTPVKTVVETHNVDKEVKNEKISSDANKHVETVKVIVTKPDGTKEETTKIVSDSNRSTSSVGSDKVSRDDSSRKETVRGSQPVTLLALGAINPFASLPLLDYGLLVSKPVIGPITIGVFGFRSGVVGAGVGVTF